MYSSISKNSNPSTSSSRQSPLQNLHPQSQQNAPPLLLPPFTYNTAKTEPLTGDNVPFPSLRLTPQENTTQKLPNPSQNAYLFLSDFWKNKPIPPVVCGLQSPTPSDDYVFWPLAVCNSDINPNLIQEYQVPLVGGPNGYTKVWRICPKDTFGNDFIKNQSDVKIVLEKKTPTKIQSYYLLNPHDQLNSEDWKKINQVQKDLKQQLRERTFSESMSTQQSFFSQKTPPQESEEFLHGSQNFSTLPKKRTLSEVENDNNITTPLLSQPQGNFSSLSTPQPKRSRNILERDSTLEKAAIEKLREEVQGELKHLRGLLECLQGQMQKQEIKLIMKEIDISKLIKDKEKYEEFLSRQENQIKLLKRELELNKITISGLNEKVDLMKQKKQNNLRVTSSNKSPYQPFSSNSKEEIG